MRRVPVLLFLFLALPLAAQRLAPDVVPSHYTLALDVDLAGREFSGEETIAITASSPTSRITLNSLGLTITRAAIDGVTAAVETDETAEQITISVPQAVAAGAHTLSFAWTGTLSDTNLRGLYVSRTSRRDYGATQLQGTYARMVFPSFDEPSFKATFDLNVTVDAGDTVISNGRIVRDEPAGAGRHRLTFSTTPRMSTYLLALAIGDFRCIAGEEAGVPLRVCAVPEKIEQARFALEAARAVLRFDQQWFSIPYPFGKLDLVAIPDYEWGGMENTASIFFRESSLLVTNDASPARRAGVAGLVSHEIAHQWFGDLVTAAWWDDIWLNEGFATWMAPLAVAAWRPEWATATDAARETQGAISVDALRSSRAIHATASTPGEIKEMFDAIAYQKGAALLRMLEAYVGPETFRRGVNAYLEAHANGNATSAHFAAALSRASQKPVDEILRTFVTEPGVPLVTFEQTCANGGGRVTMRQERFVIGDAAPADAQARWNVPVCVKLDETTRCELLTSATASFDTPRCPASLFGNANALGYYRSAYRSATPNARFLSAPERIALIEDAAALVRAGRGDASQLLDIAASLGGERDRGVAASLASSLRFVRSQLTDPSLVPYFDRWVRRTFAPAAKAIGWTPRANEPDARRELRATMLELLGTAGDPEALRVARRIVDRALAGEASQDPTLTEAAVHIAASTGDAALFNRFAERFNAAKSNDDYRRYLFGLASFPDPSLAERMLSIATSDNVRLNDYPSLFALLLQNPATRDATWSHLKANWPELRTRVVSFGGRGAVQALGSFCTPALREDVRAFFATNDAPGAERALAQALERMDACIALRRSQAPVVATWLELRELGAE